MGENIFSNIEGVSDKKDLKSKMTKCNDMQKFIEDVIKPNKKDIIKSLNTNNSYIMSELLIKISKNSSLSKTDLNNIIEKYDEDYSKDIRENLSLSIYYSCENIDFESRTRFLRIISKEDSENIFYNLLMAYWIRFDGEQYIKTKKDFRLFEQGIPSVLPDERTKILPIVDILHNSIRKHPNFVNIGVVNLLIERKETMEYGLDFAYYLSKKNSSKIPEIENKICKAYKTVDYSDSAISHIIENSPKKLPKLQKLYVSEKISNN